MNQTYPYNNSSFFLIPQIHAIHNVIFSKPTSSRIYKGMKWAYGEETKK